MATNTLAPRPRSSDQSARTDHVSVGRYTTYEGAARAAKHLIDGGHEPDAILIAGHHLHAPRAHRLEMRLVRRALLLVLCSALVLMAGTGLLAVSARSEARGAVLWIAAAVSVLAFVAALPAWVRMREELDDRAGAPVEPDHFDVLCAVSPLEARHRLARWWDSAAAPASDDSCRSRPPAVRAPRSW
jgi:hypothetical protein